MAEIASGVIIMKDGSLRMAMMVSATNFELRSEQEQDALTVGYQNFLNSLEFPIQIVIQSRRINLNPYLKKLDDQRAQTSNELIGLQLDSYSDFLRRLLTLANIMTKKFYIIIPYTPPVLKRDSIVAQLMQNVGRQVKNVEITNFNHYYKELAQSARVVASGLNSLGLRAVQLNTQELIELYYNTYNPEMALYAELGEIQKIVKRQTIPGAEEPPNRQGE
jgi:type IV secretory pathway VirB4 component